MGSGYFVLRIRWNVMWWWIGFSFVVVFSNFRMLLFVHSMLCNYFSVLLIWVHMIIEKHVAPHFHSDSINLDRNEKWRECCDRRLGLEIKQPHKTALSFFSEALSLFHPHKLNTPTHKTTLDNTVKEIEEWWQLILVSSSTTGWQQTGVAKYSRERLYSSSKQSSIGVRAHSVVHNE